MARIALTSSPGACGRSCEASIARSRNVSPRASTSRSIDGRLPVRLDAGDQERLAAHVIEHREALLALRDQMVGAVRAR